MMLSMMIHQWLGATRYPHSLPNRQTIDLIVGVDHLLRPWQWRRILEAL